MAVICLSSCHFSLVIFHSLCCYKSNIFFWLQVEFDDVIAEPEGTYSPACVWRNSKYIFTCSKNCCYRCLSIVCGLPIAFIVGCSFACITFQHVWCIGPALRQFTINCHAVKQFLRTALDACMGPCCSTLGLVLSRIRISHSNDGGRTHV